MEIQRLTSEVPRGGQIEVARVYSGTQSETATEQGRAEWCHCYRASVYVYKQTHRVAHSAQTDWECDIELQEAEAGHAGEVWLARQKWV